MASDRTRELAKDWWKKLNLQSATAYPSDLVALLDAFERDRRDKCFKDMYRFIENCRKDSTPDVPAYETLTVMLQTLNDCGSGGFGDSDWRKLAAQPTPEKERGKP